jgi:ribosomal protein S18 acetylase RimI-like enzyme
MKTPNIYTMSPSDWIKYKSIRLDSLKESPNAFGSTLKREASFSDDIWAKRLIKIDDDAKNLPLIVEINAQPVGLASGRIAPLKSNIVHVYQMWVNPKYRGLGIGKLLLDQIVLWTKSININHIALSVTNRNSPAKILYLSYGFRATGEFEPLREGSNIVVRKLVLNINELAA